VTTRRPGTRRQTPRTDARTLGGHPALEPLDGGHGGPDLPPGSGEARPGPGGAREPGAADPRGAGARESGAGGGGEARLAGHGGGGGEGSEEEAGGGGFIHGGRKWVVG
jgi:hypothetical protein